MRKREAEKLAWARLAEWDPDEPNFSITMMPEMTRGEWAVAVCKVDEAGRRDPNFDLTMYVHKNGAVEGPY